MLTPKLLSSLSSAAETVRRHDNVHIFSHHDADGISAAIILSKAMMRARKGFEVTLLGALTDDSFKEIQNCGAECIMIADMGVSYITELEKIDADIVVLDHHLGEASPENVHYINPHSFGIDGMTGGCGSSLAALFAVAYDNNNWDLVQIAFAGIVGDKQHRNISGINEYLFAEGEKKGYVTKADGSIIPPGPLMSSLFLSVDPYIRNVSGNAEGVTALLNDAGIDPVSSFSDMTDAEKRKLSSLIASKLLIQGVTRETLEDVACVRYMITDTDAGTLASILDACGRSGKGGVGIGSGLGDMKCMAEGIAMNDAFRKRMVEDVIAVDKKGLEQMDHIQYFDASDTGSTGMVCEVAMRYFGDQDKPTIGFGMTDGNVKVSGRCTMRLLDKGVDLSAAMRKAGETVGGGGGGHRIASGAWFGAEKKEEFLTVLDNIIGEQISAK
ncbi:MAG: DHH family phosphoesterase [Methanomassiliicoccaceae archaeon]|nr:DHH family phosphoesterase [Methanomassiliicoccaceae archaeon]